MYIYIYLHIVIYCINVFLSEVFRKTSPPSISMHLQLDQSKFKVTHLQEIILQKLLFNSKILYKDTYCTLFYKLAFSKIIYH